MSLRPLICATTLMLSSLTATAQGVDAQYTLSLRGITGGTIALRGRDQGGSYAVSSAAQASGMVGALVKYGFEGSVQGTVNGGRYAPTIYTEVEDDDGERTSSVTRFRNGTPTDVTFDPPRAPEPHDVDPTAQRGVIDPLTALYDVLQPVDAAGACDRRYDLFDGRGVSRLTLAAPRARGDGTVTCASRYLRVRGYSPEDLAKRPSVDMTFIYAPLPDGRVQVSEIRSSTRLGDMVLRRQ
ncbi:DUF3108 domain-containing protein [Jannaschia sp. 2305UL9-9]|uniref:DUF3108 domain-containing protein n=1 Tax=Jannaschia sp. 2305UL9-9 TaxID=3121638 RepID=UPI003529D16B